MTGRHFTGRALGLLAAMLLAAAGTPAPASADGPAGADAKRTCIRIERITAFAPRGQIYVSLHSSCDESDFAREDPVLAYLEVLVGELPPIGQDVRVYSDDPRRQQTVVFRELTLNVGQLVLVRLVRFGEILDLQSVKVP